MLAAMKFMPGIIPKVVPYLTRFIAEFPLQWPDFDPWTDHVGFEVDKSALGRMVSEYFHLPY
jgi:hypothetical protein